MTRTLPNKLVALVLAFACLATAMLSAVNSADAQAHSSKAGTTLSIESSAPGFSGELTSNRSSCESNRKVVLYKQVGHSRNMRKDKKVGSDIAQPNGDAGMYHVDSGPTGRFYAYVAANSRCKAAVSRTISPSLA